MEITVALRREARALWSEGRGTSLVAVATAWGLLIGARMIYPVLIPSLQSSFGMSLTVAGLLVTVLWLCGAVGQLPGGILADAYSERTIMAVSVVTVAAALGLVIAAPTAIVLFAATAVWGLGHSLYPVARITFLSNIYPGRVGSALGVTMATGDVGQTVLPPVAAVIAAAFVWQAGLAFVIPLLAVLGAVIWLTLPGREPVEGSADSEDADADGTGSLENAREVLSELRRPSLGFITGILFLYIFIWQSFTAFYPTYLIEIKGLSPSIASTLFGLFFAMGVVVKPFAGAAYDRIGMRGSLVGVLAPPVAGFFLLPLLDTVWSLAAATALISSMLGSGAVTQSYLADSFSEEMRGTGLGVIRTLTATLGAAGPVVFGVVADNGYFDQGYLALAAIMGAVVLLTLRVPRV